MHVSSTHARERGKCMFPAHGAHIHHQPRPAVPVLRKVSETRAGTCAGFSLSAATQRERRGAPTQPAEVGWLPQSLERRVGLTPGPPPPHPRLCRPATTPSAPAARCVRCLSRLSRPVRLLLRAPRASHAPSSSARRGGVSAWVRRLVSAHSPSCSRQPGGNSPRRRL